MDIIHFLGLDTFQAADFLVIATLIVLEGLLSCDNAIALAMLVRKLPKEQQGKALRYGIIGAYTFLFIALCLATWIINQWYLKLLGGLYLLWVASSHLFGKHEDADGTPVEKPLRRLPGLSVFWSTVVLVELTDIAFSVDSIAAAVALSSKFWVLLAAGMIYILVMRYAAQGFIALLHRFPHLETMAFLAVAVIGLKLSTEFPADLVGGTKPITTPYATTQEYIAAAEKQYEPFVIPHVLTWSSTTVEAPVEANFPASEHGEKEYRHARSHWNLHLRPILKFEEAVMPVLILGLFGFGFIGKRRKKDA
jgi:YkoY family integral membrane protein